MRLSWTPTAERDLESVFAYIADDSRAAAERTVDKILVAAEALWRHPEMGRKGRVRGTRELVETPYVIAYRVKRSEVQILAVIHGARQWPDSF